MDGAIKVFLWVHGCTEKNYWPIKGTVNQESWGSSVVSFYTKYFYIINMTQFNCPPVFIHFPSSFSPPLVSNLSHHHHSGNFMKTWKLTPSCPLPPNNLSTFEMPDAYCSLELPAQVVHLPGTLFTLELFFLVDVYIERIYILAHTNTRVLICLHYKEKSIKQLNLIDI